MRSTPRPASRRSFLLGAASLTASSLAASRLLAAPWPMYRNATHDGHSSEKISKQWPAGGPPVLWKVPMGLGFSAVSVAGGKAFVNAEQNGQECCVCLDANTGKTLWSQPIDKSITDRQGGDGPRSTPTVDGDRVYFLGTHLKLACLNVADGKPVWGVDLMKQYGGKEIGWGNAASPVLDGERIFVNSGGGKGHSLLAFDKASGKELWHSQDDGLVHASPTVATIEGVRQVIFFTQTGLVSVLPESGQKLWRYDFPYRTSTASSPIVGDDGLVYCSANYGVGAGCCKVTKSGSGFEAKEVWRQQGKLMNHWTTPVYADGHVYGLYKDKPVSLRCIEMATGKEAWVQEGFQWQGATVFVDGCVLVQDNGGALVLVEATPAKYTELARCKPLDGKCWTMPTVSDGRIYCRSDHEVVCLDVSSRSA